MNALDRLDVEQISWIEDAVLIGLASHGELERLRGMYELRATGGDESTQDERPLIIDDNAASKFATALITLRPYRRERTDGQPAPSSESSTVASVISPEVEAEFGQVAGTYALFYRAFIQAQSDDIDKIAARANVTGDELVGAAESVERGLYRLQKLLRGESP